MLLGFLVRYLRVAYTDFPIGDGGLFYLMTRELQQSGYVLPRFTSYNKTAIPFAYPPLPFYLAALTDAIAPGTLLDVFHWLPLVVSVASIAAFFFLARALLPSDIHATFATFAFALVPEGFIWLLMGGGLTRAFGLLFAIVALRESYFMFRTGRQKPVWSTAIAAALTAASHLETAWYLAFSMGLLFIAYGRSREALYRGCFAWSIALLLTLPWWITVVVYHGLSPFLASSETAGINGSSPIGYLEVLWQSRTLPEPLASIFRLNFTAEPFFPVLNVLALIGVVICFGSGSLLLPAWLIAAMLLDSRSYLRAASIPVALLAGIGLVTGILPLLTPKPWLSRLSALSDNENLIGLVVNARSGILLMLFLLYSTLAARSAAPPLLTALPSDERAAMQWISQHTPASSRFLVVSAPSAWWGDWVSEWFPVLAERTSLATVQGSEWLPGDAFAARVDSHDRLQQCSNADGDCLAKWSEHTGLTFTHIYIPRSNQANPLPLPLLSYVPPGTCCQGLENALRNDRRYRLEYTGPGGVVFAFVESD